MDIHGPTCASLIETGLTGSQPARGKFGRFDLLVRPLRIVKTSDLLRVTSGERRLRAFGSLGLPRGGSTVAFSITERGHLGDIHCSDRSIEEGLAVSLRRAGPLTALVEHRDIGERPNYWPSDLTLALLDETWRGELRFLLANVVLAAVRKFVAVRHPTNSRSVSVENVYALGDVVYPLIRRRSRAAA